MRIHCFSFYIELSRCCVADRETDDQRTFSGSGTKELLQIRFRTILEGFLCLVMQIWRRNPHLAPPSSLLLSKTTPHTLPLTTILPRMFHFLSFLSLSSPFFSYIPFLYPILFYTHSLFIKHTLYLCIFRSLCLPLRPPSTHILSSIVPFSFVTHSYHFLPLLSFFPISPIFSLSVLSPSMLTISLYVWPSSFHILIFPPSYTHSSYV